MDEETWGLKGEYSIAIDKGGGKWLILFSDSRNAAKILAEVCRQNHTVCNIVRTSVKPVDFK